MVGFLDAPQSVLAHIQKALTLLDGREVDGVVHELEEAERKQREMLDGFEGVYEKLADANPGLAEAVTQETIASMDPDDLAGMVSSLTGESIPPEVEDELAKLRAMQEGARRPGMVVADAQGNVRPVGPTTARATHAHVPCETGYYATIAPGVSVLTFEKLTVRVFLDPYPRRDSEATGILDDLRGYAPAAEILADGRALWRCPLDHDSKGFQIGTR